MENVEARVSTRNNADTSRSNLRVSELESDICRTYGDVLQTGMCLSLKEAIYKCLIHNSLSNIYLDDFLRQLYRKWLDLCRRNVLLVQRKPDINVATGQILTNSLVFALPEELATTFVNDNIARASHLLAARYARMFTTNQLGNNTSSNIEGELTDQDFDDFDELSQQSVLSSSDSDRN